MNSWVCTELLIKILQSVQIIEMNWSLFQKNYFKLSIVSFLSIQFEKNAFLITICSLRRRFHTNPCQVLCVGVKVSNTLKTTDAIYKVVFNTTQYFLLHLHNFFECWVTPFLNDSTLIISINFIRITDVLMSSF